ncbi:transposon Ty3-G Gag-Pol polyprotein [Trichonephila clavipes]|nr:transposon Ty3-G Gag-Pol polyprotein [Trichonephila clavipes]
MAEAQSFELLKIKRKSLRTAVNKIVNELEAELSNSDLNVDRLSELVETLCIKFEPLTLIDQQMEPLFKHEEFDAEFEIVEKCREKAHLGVSALNTVEGFPISAKAYDEAVELLKNRFANPGILIQAHMNKILSLQPLKNSNDRSFRKFVDNCNVQFRSLNSLGVSSANYGVAAVAEWYRYRTVACFVTATQGLLATDHVILNHGQVTWTTPELAPPTPHQREDVSALDRFNVHRCPTRRVFSGTGIELMTCLPWLDTLTTGLPQPLAV